MRQAIDIGRARNLLEANLPEECSEERQCMTAAISALDWALGRPGRDSESFADFLAKLETNLEEQVKAQITTIWSN